MTDRITKPITNMKEYGRKPYLEKDYQNMMEATWHKAQDNSQIVVQSVKKKPYDPFTYQEMEQKGDLPIFTYPRDNFYKWDFPFNKSDATVPTSRYKPINPRINPTGLKYVSPNDSMSKDYRANLRWILCPETVEGGNWYTIRVANSVKSTYKTEGGRTSLQRYIYYPSFFSFRNLTKETTGFELKVFLPSAVYDNYGSIMGLWHDSYQWYDTKKQAGQIRELINYLWQRGYAGANMEARLIANTGAEGEIELQATDGRNVIKKKVQMGAGMVLYAVDKYYKISDLINGVTLGYNNFTQTKPFTKGPTPSVTYSESSDEGRPTETITYTYSYKWGGSEAFTSTDYRYNYYTPAPPPFNWGLHGYVLDGYYGEVYPPSDYTSGIYKIYRLYNVDYGGTDDYEEVENTYIYHFFNGTYTDYPATWKIDYCDGTITGYRYSISYDFDANNYTVMGVDYDSGKTLLKGKNKGADFAISVSLLPNSVLYGTVS
jgi:hypothetical protein